MVRGDLDWIVMKALEKDRARRYETANGMARDVQRYLAQEPVEASPPSATYRLVKFVRRNRARLLAAAALALTLLAGVAAVAVVQVRANQRACGRGDAPRRPDGVDRRQHRRGGRRGAATGRGRRGAWPISPSGCRSRPTRRPRRSAGPPTTPRASRRARPHSPSWPAPVKPWTSWRGTPACSGIASPVKIPSPTRSTGIIPSARRAELCKGHGAAFARFGLDPLERVHGRDRPDDRHQPVARYPAGPAPGVVLSCRLSFGLAEVSARFRPRMPGGRPSKPGTGSGRWSGRPGCSPAGPMPAGRTSSTGRTSRAWSPSPARRRR